MTRIWCSCCRTNLNGIKRRSSNSNNNGHVYGHSCSCDSGTTDGYCNGFNGLFGAVLSASIVATVASGNGFEGVLSPAPATIIADVSTHHLQKISYSTSLNNSRNAIEAHNELNPLIMDAAAKKHIIDNKNNSNNYFLRKDNHKNNNDNRSIIDNNNSNSRKNIQKLKSNDKMYRLQELIQKQIKTDNNVDDNNNENKNYKKINDRNNDGYNHHPAKAPPSIMSMTDQESKSTSYSFSKRYENERFALKQISKDSLINLQSFEKEGRILIKLKPSSIVSSRRYVDKKNYYIATKYCHDGSFLDCIFECKCFNEQEASFYLKTTLDAIEYYHSKPIVHRDIKPGNIVLNKKPIINLNGKVGFANDAKLIIIDFGFALELETLDKNTNQLDNNVFHEQRIGTLVFVPHEIKRGRTGIMEKGEMLSIGVIAYFLLCGKRHFLITVINLHYMQMV